MCIGDQFIIDPDLLNESIDPDQIIFDPILCGS